MTTGTSNLRTRGKKVQDSQPPAKRTRLASSTATLTRTIHQKVSSNSDQTCTVSVTMAQQLKKPAKNNKIPSSCSTSVGASTSCSSRLPVHPTGAQHPRFPSPTPGMEQPTAQLPTMWWGPWGPPPPPGHCLTPIVMGTIITCSSQVQGHTPGFNNSNNHLRFHQQHQQNNRPGNKLQVWGQHQPLLHPQQHIRICQIMPAAMVLWQKKMLLLIH